MKVNDNFIKAINERDIKMLQAIINNSFITDPTTGTIREMLQIIKENNIDIFEQHDNKVLYEEKRYWTRDYEKQLLSDLFLNFSRERITLLLKIVPYVECNQIEQEIEQNKNKTVKPAVTVSTRTTRRRPVTYKKNSSPLPYVAVGGVVVAALGLITSTTTITVIGGVVCVAGAAGYLMTKK
ncbi:hypothetical protein [Megamonas hypermegale]|uniref:hypothetical protein n=1 Tax=Megamonas hypermegale TaxID=158847 RepID=UPI0026F276C9|nr:hypothetical protein [Megamonas hypermegale]